MKQTPAENVVAFLRFSEDAVDRANEFKKFSPGQWERVLRWLDDAGLAFYFLQKLKDTDAADALPGSVVSRLEQNFAANQGRLEAMSGRFDFLNHKFELAGVAYAVMKGLSLVPEFCPDARLRYQSDFDYLIDDKSLAAAQLVLVEAGYSGKESRSSKESIYVLPKAEEPSRSGEQYQARAPHAVELHVDVWDSKLHGLRVPKLFCVERAATHSYNGFIFPALTDEDAFLLQVLHACHHLFTQWIRMSCLYEIAYFLNRRASDLALWERIEQRVADDCVLREFTVVVAEMAAKLFATPLPPLISRWGEAIRPGPRLWIERYGRRWAFCELPVYQFSLFPRTKLVLFLRRQYEDTAHAPGTVEPGRTLPSSRLARIAWSLRHDPSLVLNAGWWKRQQLFRRSIFYVLAGMRYLCEIPRWRWLNRSRARAC